MYCHSITSFHCPLSTVHYQLSTVKLPLQQNSFPSIRFPIVLVKNIMKKSTIRDLTRDLIHSFGSVLVRPQKKASLLVVIRALQRIATSPWIYLLKLRLGKDQSQLPLLGIINYHKLLPLPCLRSRKQFICLTASCQFYLAIYIYALLPLASFTFPYL